MTPEIHFVTPWWLLDPQVGNHWVTQHGNILRVGLGIKPHTSFQTVSVETRLESCHQMSGQINDAVSVFFHQVVHDSSQAFLPV